MIKEIIYTLKSPHRDDMRITGYKFGKGGKSACIVGAIREMRYSNYIRVLN